MISNRILRQVRRPGRRLDCLLSRSFSVYTGTIKFYLRDKQYGFIQPDAPDEVGGEDVFVHRTGIRTDLPLDGIFLNRPYLIKGERVGFEVEPKEDGSPNAINVTFENGSTVPPFRKYYVSGVVKGEREKVGAKLIAAYNDGVDEAELLVLARESIQEAVSTIQKAHENYAMYGPPKKTKEGEKSEDAPST